MFCSLLFLDRIGSIGDRRMRACRVLCYVCVVWYDTGNEDGNKIGTRGNPVTAHSQLLSKSTKGATKLNFSIRRITINNDIYLLNIDSAEEFGI